MVDYKLDVWVESEQLLQFKVDCLNFIPVHNSVICPTPT